MKKQTMLDYLETCLEKELGEYDFAIDWDTKKHLVEVIVVLYGHNNQTVTVEDLEGIVSEEEIIEFEDSVLLCAGDTDAIDEEDYLAVISFDKKKGMSSHTLKGLAKYLAAVLVEGESDLLDFLQDEGQDVFELVWNEKEFEETVATVKGEDILLPYPRY